MNPKSLSKWFYKHTARRIKQNVFQGICAGCETVIILRSSHQEKIFLALALGIQYFVKRNDPLDSINLQSSLKIRAINCPEEARCFEIKDTGKRLNFYKKVQHFCLESRQMEERVNQGIFRRRKKKLQFVSCFLNKLGLKVIYQIYNQWWVGILGEKYRLVAS